MKTELLTLNHNNMSKQESKVNHKRGNEVIASFMVRFVNWVFNSKYGFKLPNLIKKLYQQVRKDEFKISEKIVKVKKGKTRFILIFFETENQKTRVNIGRNKKDISVII